MQMLERFNHKRAAITTELHAIGIAKKAGLIGGSSPLEVVRIMRTMRTLGAMTAALVNSARKHPDRTAIIDELGSVTYAELDRRTNVLANAWLARGLTSGDGIAILSLAAMIPMMAGRIDLTVGYGIVLWHILAIALQTKYGIDWRRFKG